MRLRICKWAEHQHYKDRNPPWIKLHFKTLHSKTWVTASDADRVLAIACMLIASQDERNDGSFDGDPDYFQRIAYLNQAPNFKSLIDRGFLEVVEANDSERKRLLADARPEAEAEAEAEAEHSTVPPAAAGSPAAPAAAATAQEKYMPSVREVFAHWQQVHNHPQAKLDPKRYRVVVARLKDGYSVDQLKLAIDGCKKSPHHMGENDRHTVYDDLELICRDGAHVDKFIKLSGAPAQAIALTAAGRQTATAAQSWLAKRATEEASRAEA